MIEEKERDVNASLGILQYLPFNLIRIEGQIAHKNAISMGMFRLELLRLKKEGKVSLDTLKDIEETVIQDRENIDKYINAQINDIIGGEQKIQERDKKSENPADIIEKMNEEKNHNECGHEH